jgi:hypothetical protein
MQAATTWAVRKTRSALPYRTTSYRQEAVGDLRRRKSENHKGLQTTGDRTDKAQIALASGAKESNSMAYHGIFALGCCVSYTLTGC